MYSYQLENKKSQLPVRFVVDQADDVPVHEVKALSSLTNSYSRGDVDDDGSHAGSMFQSYIDDRMVCGYFGKNVWIVRAFVGEDVAAWSMIVCRSHWTSRKYGDVGFYVNPLYRRRGLGSSLHRCIVDFAREHGLIALYASPWNRRSQEFFDNLGFRTTKTYVPGGESGSAEFVV